MWPDADKLNEQTLEELGVEEGGLIHCAVRLAHSLTLVCARPRGSSEAAAHTPPTQAQSSEFRVYYSQGTGKPAGIALQAAPREYCPNSGTQIHAIPRRCARCAVTTSTRLSLRMCTASWWTLSGTRSGWARPTPTKAIPTPARSQTSRRECAAPDPPQTHTPRSLSHRLPRSPPALCSCVPRPTSAQVRLSHHDDAPALRHACGAGVLVRRRADPLAPGHLVAVVPAH